MRRFLYVVAFAEGQLSSVGRQIILGDFLRRRAIFGQVPPAVGAPGNPPLIVEGFFDTDLV